MFNKKMLCCFLKILMNKRLIKTKNLIHKHVLKLNSLRVTYVLGILKCVLLLCFKIHNILFIPSTKI